MLIEFWIFKFKLSAEYELSEYYVKKPTTSQQELGIAEVSIYYRTKTKS